MHNKIKHYKIPLVSSTLGIGGMFLFSYLTFTPSQTFAAYDWETRKLSDIDTMQEMNTKICENTTEIETQYQLEDTRDHKKYWVSKLKGGNCWMTQNLDFNVPDEITSLTSNTSDTVDMTNDGINSRIETIAEWKDTNYNPNHYYDPGNFIYVYPNHGRVPDGQNTCDNVTSFTATGCRNYFAEADSSSNLHYHVGNFYTFGSANAKTTNASRSICPQGWKLPTSNNTLMGSFAHLLNTYDIVGSSDNLYGEPLFFVYGGYLHTGGYLSYAGRTGDYWSSTAVAGNISSYHLFMDAENNASADWSRGVGMSVRCLADMANYPKLDSNSEANVAITVSPIINLDVAKSADDMVVDFNSIDTSTIDINVSSNQKYQVTLTTDQPNLIPNKSDNSEYSIKMVGTSGGIVEKGKNGWGIKKKLSATNDNNLGSLVDEPTYSPIGTNNDQITFYRSAGPEALTNQTDPANPLQLEVGVSVDQSLPSDTYSTMVTVTAMAI